MMGEGSLLLERGPHTADPPTNVMTQSISHPFLPCSPPSNLPPREPAATSRVFQTSPILCWPSSLHELLFQHERGKLPRPGWDVRNSRARQVSRISPLHPRARLDTGHDEGRRSAAASVCLHKLRGLSWDIVQRQRMAPVASSTRSVAPDPRGGT
jgi:hypothetical protein